jgi:hypothetical protein
MQIRSKRPLSDSGVLTIQVHSSGTKRAAFDGFCGRREGSPNTTRIYSLFIITLKDFLMATKGVYRTSEKKFGKRLFGMPLLKASLPLPFKQKFALLVATIFSLSVEK